MCILTEQGKKVLPYRDYPSTNLCLQQFLPSVFFCLYSLVYLYYYEIERWFHMQLHNISVGESKVPRVSYECPPWEPQGYINHLNVMSVHDFFNIELQNFWEIFLAFSFTERVDSFLCLSLDDSQDSKA